ncbi:TonB family protein [Mucilaginibacter gracilis]|uniref:TonB family protein n=1 Tax=Mucilaginibacter gracilis TaxID=423350 RepID=A0A495IWJ2_9SPHI|nr:energy transducer TonB [Mucilaginibacter gracilis]RKR80239.1 TonB family protein [Mucilaginibacter gracilis]
MERFKNMQLSFNCPKSINNMQACNSGWHCGACNETVHDFRGLTEAEILEAFSKSHTLLCGLYDAKRVTEMPKKLMWRKWLSAALFIVGISAFSDRAYAQGKVKVNNKTIKSAKSDTIKDVVMGFMAVTVKPQFPGGDAAFNRYVNEHVKYTGERAGPVYVSFIVEKDGTLTNIKVVKGGEPELNQQIIEIVKNSPRWRGGIDSGRPMRAEITVPISF